jgi:hypothetical protein
VSGLGCCPLVCRHCHVCVGWVVISIFDLRMFHPVALVLVRGVIVVCCLNCVLVFIVRWCGSTVVIIAFLPKKKKKKLHFSSLVVVTIEGRYIWYQSRVQPCDCGSPGFPLQ